ncbi:sulfotransferase domain-containing protein [Nocardioides KLBMP 9356]|uniref:Sulfotransferase domain-containing protein n=1 Tax=Nocardioides potassii TaxID=2911371 RepID=A0ABS9HGB8_9ACTN|nr:sulfotransferase [Nocardioides potassii]MCF6379265.1 sulfotransferase domain-containing protein [Nocardioides potassii]
MNGATDHPARHVLLVGAQRCGTTYLGASLDAHPQITLAQPSRPEPKVWCDAALAAQGHAAYDDHFFAHARDELLLLDKSTSYLEDPEAPGRAAAALGDPLVLVVLRDPVQRAISNWRFSTDHGLETRGLEEALLADLAGEQPWDPGTSSVSPFAYVRRGRYVDHLPAWLETFPRSTHVVFLEELLADPDVLRDLVARLGAAPELTPEPVGHPVNQSSAESPVSSHTLQGTLQEYYEPANAALADLLGRKVPW